MFGIIAGMNTTQIGRNAEMVAADYLESRGFTVLEHNWRTNRCEIDIIAQKGPVKYFVECKYRRSGSYGRGFDHITDKKIQQMQFAAAVWVQRRQWDGAYFLSAIELAGKPPCVQGFIPII